MVHGIVRKDDEMESTISVCIITAVLWDVGCDSATRGSCDPEDAVIDSLDAADDPLDSGPRPDSGLCGGSRLAPPDMPFGGAVATAIDIERLDANVTFYVMEEQAVAASKLTFSMGESSGFPMFDLRQRPTAIRLDNEPVGVGALERVDFASTDTGGVLVLRVALHACTRHTLDLTYELRSDEVGQGPLPAWDDGAFWNSAFSDSAPGMLLERWFPAGLIHDNFQFDMEAHVVGEGDYTLVANASSHETLGANHWRVSWLIANSSTPLWYLSPSHHVRHRQDDAGSVNIYYAQDLSHAEPDYWLAITQEAIQDYTTRFGVRADAERPYLLIVDPSGQVTSGTEYTNGAIVSNATRDVLRHEILHAWFGRSLMPARYTDAWWDEGAAVFFSADDSTVPVVPLDPLDPFDPDAVPIASSDPWARSYPLSAYTVGARVFATLAHLLGREEVESALRGLVSRCPYAHITNNDLLALFASIGEPELVEALFASWVIVGGEPVVTGDCR